MQDDLSLPELLPNLGLKMKILPWKNSESSKNERFEKASYKQGLPSFEYVTQSYKYMYFFKVKAYEFTAKDTYITGHFFIVLHHLLIVSVDC